MIWQGDILNTMPYICVRLHMCSLGRMDPSDYCKDIVVVVVDLPKLVTFFLFSFFFVLNMCIVNGFILYS
jgi:hypothetical protein